MSPLQFFKNLSDDTRLKSILLIHHFQEICVCDLMEALQLDQPKVSRHLALLKASEILIDERRGKWVFYKIHPNLPEWAKLIISQTTDENKPYYLAELNRIKHSKQADCHLTT